MMGAQPAKGEVEPHPAEVDYDEDYGWWSIADNGGEDDPLIMMMMMEEQDATMYI